MKRPFSPFACVAVICLLAAILILLYWGVRDTPDDAYARHQSGGAPAPPGTDTKDAVKETVQPGSSVAATRWLTAHRTDIRERNIGYTDEDWARGLFYPLHQIKGPGQSVVLISEHHEGRYHAYRMEMFSNDAWEGRTAAYELRYPRINSSIGGFLFDAAENPPSRVGIIIPEVIEPDPEGVGQIHGKYHNVELLDRHDTSHYMRSEMETKADEVILSADSIIFPTPEQRTVAAKVRVLWIKLQPSELRK
jgi:hypothetical protein